MVPLCDGKWQWQMADGWLSDFLCSLFHIFMVKTPVFIEHLYRYFEVHFEVYIECSELNWIGCEI